MRLLERFAKGIDTLNEWCGRGVAWLTLAMVLVTFAIVILRYVFNLGWIAMQESVTYMHGLVFMIGAAYTLKHDGHVRVDIFYAKFGARVRASIDLLGAALLLIPVMGFIFYVSWDYVSESWALLEGSRETGGLPGVFLLKTAILVMAGLMVLQGLSQIARNILILSGRPEYAPEHDAKTEV